MRLSLLVALTTIFLFLNKIYAVNIVDSTFNVPISNNKTASSASIKSNQLKDTALVQNIDSPKIVKTGFIPSRVVWMGSIIPGYGQIANKKYWKLPIVYAGFGTCAYFIGFNNNNYLRFRKAYSDFTDSDINTKSYLELIPEGYTIQDFGGNDAFANLIKGKQDYYRRYKEMSIILTAVFYAATLVDAYVDAQLFDYDISPNLSLHFQPSILQIPNYQSNIIGVQCNFNLK